LRFAVREGGDPVALARKTLDDKGISIQGAREARATVEDAFVAMVRAGE
jgi:hypothetical protein